MYWLFKNLGWVNIGLLVLIIMHFILRRVNKYALGNKSKFLKKASKLMSSLHPYLTGLLLISAFLHGYNLVGGIRLHSGFIAFFVILLQTIFGILVKKFFKKPILIIHRFTGLAIVIAVITHVVLMKT
ncbi:MAG: hypothetical protein JXN10_09775 [Clostridia bacterium]|nr:hypothetical protein [Clostridia bacterium]MBN2883806.1 hypothetical protein [Clostridia bacterium]